MKNTHQSIKDAIKDNEMSQNLIDIKNKVINIDIPQGYILEEQFRDQEYDRIVNN